MTQAKISSALEDVAVQMRGAMIYSSAAQGIANTTSGSYFSVPSSDEAEYVILYRNDNGLAIKISTYPNAQAVKAVKQQVDSATVAIDQVSSQIKPFPSEETDVVRLRQLDTEGGLIAQLSDSALRTIPFTILVDAGSTAILDSEGSVVLLDEPGRTIVGPFEMQVTDAPGVFATDIEGALLGVEDEVVAQSPFDGGLLFSPLIATSPAIRSVIYPQNILQYRERDTALVATLASLSTTASSSGRAMSVDAERYGPAAMLGLRRLDLPSDHRFMPLTLVNVPVQAQPTPIKVLVIGDSIGNRQGATLTKQYLEAQGFSVTLVGTMPGSALPNDPNNASGGLGEAREGWETGDYTYAQTDMANIVAPGGEAAYLSGSKAYKYSRNPFLRAATESDNPAIVRNGCVFDPAFYQSRFGLQAPDVVVNLLGTNDASHRTDATVYAEVFANDTLMHSQIAAAWPDAKIIRSVPGTSFDTTRNALWSTRYAPVIRAIKDAAAGNAAVIVAPVWAMTDPESGYPISASAPGTDGFVSGNFSDPTHPQGSSRHSLFASLAPFIAGAALDLI
ncbi:SGNH/GDSL hydrolase family protein [Pseudomonas cremoricolorata]|uniref:SGNH/GDSL hydrolase family protein n=1 Tax=Pseudomonas cremoricolorata TaxID=157783 RepID=UPI001427A11C|nr:SGNH/GDSL hydrolase family protein [Pseudomonas cremoricolorata]